MNPSEAFQTVVAAMPDDFNIPADDYLAVRQKMKPWHGHPLDAATSVHYTSAAGRDLAWLRSADCDRPDRVALFCHGGGFVSCTMPEYLFFAEHISSLLNCQVVTPDYRLAPENRFPAAQNDCFEAYRSLLDSGLDPSKVFSIGDSCGGGLALSALLIARDEGLRLPACHIGLTAWYDVQLAGDHLQSSERTEPMITKGWYANRVRDYLGDSAVDSQYASPARADCTGLPPLLLQVGSNDLSLDGAQRLAEQASAKGVEVELQISNGMVHGFHGLASAGVPESQQAWLAARAFLDRQIA
ncbi:MAG: alpha/beta hydrolase [Pseudomonadales bacterium]